MAFPRLNTYSTGMTVGWEVQGGELAVVFFGGAVVGPGGVDFVFEGAEVNSFAVDADAGTPALHIVCPIDAFVF